MDLIDPEQYPETKILYPKRFHPNLLYRYENWVANGGERMTIEELDTMFNNEWSDINNKLPTRPSIIIIKRWINWILYRQKRKVHCTFYT